LTGEFRKEIFTTNIITTKIKNVIIDKYVIIINHIHLIIIIDGTMRASSPTENNENIICAFKTMTTKEIGYSILGFYTFVK
jgi:REP element-mobilizing transposase RayT